MGNTPRCSARPCASRECGSLGRMRCPKRLLLALAPLLGGCPQTLTASDAATADAAPDDRPCDESACLPEPFAYSVAVGQIGCRLEARFAPCRGVAVARSTRSTSTGSCDLSLTACEVRELAARLAHPDIAPAFAGAPRTYGQPVPDAAEYTLTFRGRTVQLWGTTCEPGFPRCVPAPPGVAALFATVRGIEGRRFGESCNAPVEDAGTLRCQ